MYIQFWPMLYTSMNDFCHRPIQVLLSICHPSWYIHHPVVLFIVAFVCCCFLLIAFVLYIYISAQKLYEARRPALKARIVCMG